jgi:hypothetical protein
VFFYAKTRFLQGRILRRGDSLAQPFTT